MVCLFVSKIASVSGNLNISRTCKSFLLSLHIKESPLARYHVTTLFWDVHYCPTLSTVLKHWDGFLSRALYCTMRVFHWSDPDLDELMGWNPVSHEFRLYQALIRCIKPNRITTLVCALNKWHRNSAGTPRTSENHFKRFHHDFDWKKRHKHLAV